MLRAAFLRAFVTAFKQPSRDPSRHPSAVIQNSFQDFQDFQDLKQVSTVPHGDAWRPTSWDDTVGLCRVVSCCVVLCRDVLCRDVLCRVVSSVTQYKLNQMCDPVFCPTTNPPSRVTHKSDPPSEPNNIFPSVIPLQAIPLACVVLLIYKTLKCFVFLGYVCIY